MSYQAVFLFFVTVGFICVIHNIGLCAFCFLEFKFCGSFKGNFFHLDSASTLHYLTVFTSQLITKIILSVTFYAAFTNAKVELLETSILILRVVYL